MNKKLVYEDKENQMGVDEDGNIIDLCLNENDSEERSLDTKALFNLLIEAAKVSQMKKYGHLL